MDRAAVDTGFRAVAAGPVAVHDRQVQVPLGVVVRRLDPSTALRTGGAVEEDEQAVPVVPVAPLRLPALPDEQRRPEDQPIGPPAAPVSADR